MVKKNSVATEVTAQQSRNQSSEYLPQRREGRKGRKKLYEIIRNNFIFPSELGDFAPLREQFPIPSAFSIEIICAGRANFELQ